MPIAVLWLTVLLSSALQDTEGRLWWYESGRSCAYRGADGKPLYYIGYVQVKWDTAPACPGTATLTNSMADAQGRMWGWSDNKPCKYVKADGTAVKYAVVAAH
eukprot:GHRR01033357.1.p1 GENE.GHRR01033357.1~~GHRR01033357.1.p1  ORF type:complete len:103 (-),score=40.63 GHRR01033357.1:590-898(-)